MEWGTIDYYIDRLSSPSPPLRIDVCDANMTDDDAARLADALTSQLDDAGSGTIRTEGGGATLKKLRLRGSQITSRGFLALAEAIGGVAGSTSALEELDLGYTIEITNDVDDFAFGMYLLLSAAVNLKHLHLEGCYLGKRAGMALADVIAAHGGKLDTLNLRNNALDDKATAYLAKKLACQNSDCKSTLTKLDLGLNYLGPAGAFALAEYVIAANHSPALRCLILFGNSIGDKGAMAFARALKSNTTLKELNLGYNQISSVGVEALLCAIFDTSSLNALVDSNHTLCSLLRSHCIDDLLKRGCDVRVLFDIDNILQVNEVNSLLKLNKQSSLSSHDQHGIPPAWAQNLPLNTLSIEQLKVVIYLSKCFDMRHFLSMDRTMIPQALEFVASHFGQEKVYHLVGHWNMPELFLPDERNRSSNTMSWYNSEKVPKHVQ